MEDQKIVELFFSRSECAISETDSKYGRYCKYISQNILCNREDAEECVNDAYLDAWRAIPPHAPQNLKAFLGKLTRNLAIKALEKKQAEKRGGGQAELALAELDECISSNSSVEDLLDEALLTAAINTFLATLPAINRHIFVRRYWYVSSISDIAKQYDMSESKVKSMLFRLRKQLKAHLEKEGFFV